MKSTTSSTRSRRGPSKAEASSSPEPSAVVLWRYRFWAAAQRDLREEHRRLARVVPETVREFFEEDGLFPLRLPIVEHRKQRPQDRGGNRRPNHELTQRHQHEAQVLRMPHDRVDPVRDEDVSPLEHNFLPALVDQEEARDDDRGSDQLADAPHIAHEQRGIRCGAREEIDRQREAVHLGEEGDHEAHVGTVGLPGVLESDRGEGEEEARIREEPPRPPSPPPRGSTSESASSSFRGSLDTGESSPEATR